MKHWLYALSGSGRSTTGLLFLQFHWSSSFQIIPVLQCNQAPYIAEYSNSRLRMFTYFHANGLWRPLLFNLGNSEIFALSFKCALLSRWKVPIQSFRLPSNHLGYVKSYRSAPLIPVQELSLYIEKFEIWEKWNFCILSHLCTWSKSVFSGLIVRGGFRCSRDDLRCMI